MEMTSGVLDPDELRLHIDEAKIMLKELVAETKKLKASEGKRKANNPSYPYQQSSTTTSSWAKSCTKRSVLGKISDAFSGTTIVAHHDHEIVDGNPTPSSSNSSKKGFTFGMKLNTTEILPSTGEDVGPASYVTPYSSVLSSKNTIIPKALRFELAVINNDTPVVSEVPSEPTPQPHIKVYSFAKSPRDASKKSMFLSEEDSKNFAILEADKAYKVLKPRPTAAVIMPPPSENTRKVGLMPQTNRDHIMTSLPLQPVYEVESKRFRSPIIRIHPASDESSSRKKGFYREEQDASPGPGYYDVAAAASAILPKGNAAGKIYHKETSPTISRKRNNHILPGPGYYDVPGGVFEVEKRAKFRESFAPAESKITPQQERRLYWEEKCRNPELELERALITPSDSFTRPRSATARLGPPKPEKASATDASDSLLYRDFTSAKAFIEFIDEQLGLAPGPAMTELMPPPKPLNYAAVEPKPKLGSTMAAEARSRQETEQRISIKPGVAAVIRAKKEAENARCKFYGPQLPTPWAEESDISSLKNKQKRNQKKTTDSSESDDDSVSSEVSKLLSARSKSMSTSRVNAKENTDIASSLPVSDTAGHYLRSSANKVSAGKAVIIRQPRPHEERNPLPKHATESSHLAFLGPQLPEDWNDIRGGASTVKLDLMPGREVVKIPRKGNVTVLEFNNDLPKSDPLGPGVYDPDVGKRVGDPGHLVGGPRFDKMVARDEVVGPRGEKPEVARVKLADIVDDPELLPHEMDVDYASAKDKLQQPERLKNGILLYRRERAVGEHIDRSNPGQENLGGAWFKGMADQVKTRGAVVDMSKVRGRDDADKAKEDAIIEAELGPREQIVVEVKDWNPGMPKAPALVMADPERNPRFKPDKRAEEEAKRPVLSPKYVKDKAPSEINFSKQIGRRDKDTARVEELAVKEAVGNNENLAAAAELAHDVSNNILKGVEYTSKIRQIPIAFDMSKQKDPKHPKIEYSADHVAGAWFKGMAEEAKGKGVKVDMSKVRGRDDADKVKEDAILEAELGPREQIVVEVKDWNPGMPKAPALVMADPERNPRFKPDKRAEEEAKRPVLSPKFDINNKPATGVAMAQQPGRVDPLAAQAEEALVHGEVFGWTGSRRGDGSVETVAASKRSRSGGGGKGYVSMNKQQGDIVSKDLERTIVDQLIGRPQEVDIDIKTSSFPSRRNPKESNKEISRKPEATVAYRSAATAAAKNNDMGSEVVAGDANDVKSDENRVSFDAANFGAPPLSGALPPSVDRSRKDIMEALTDQLNGLDL